jgi:excisionase family DNA binding protein
VGGCAESRSKDGTVEQLLTANQVADRWQVPKSQVYRLTRDGKLAGVCVEIGRYYRYRLDALERWEQRAAADT